MTNPDYTDLATLHYVRKGREPIKITGVRQNEYGNWYCDPSTPDLLRVFSPDGTHYTNFSKWRVANIYPEPAKLPDDVLDALREADTDKARAILAKQPEPDDLLQARAFCRLGVARIGNVEDFYRRCIRGEVPGVTLTVDLSKVAP